MFAYTDMYRAFAAIAIIVFLTFGTIGILNGMNANAQGQMSGCPFSGTAICTMTPLQHLAAWQNMFASVPQQSPMFALLFALLAVACINFFLSSFFISSLLDRGTRFVRFIENESRTFDPLRLALARGIIHPKTF